MMFLLVVYLPYSRGVSCKTLSRQHTAIRYSKNISIYSVFSTNFSTDTLNQSISWLHSFTQKMKRLDASCVRAGHSFLQRSPRQENRAFSFDDQHFSLSMFIIANFICMKITQLVLPRSPILFFSVYLVSFQVGPSIWNCQATSERTSRMREIGMLSLILLLFNYVFSSYSNWTMRQSNWS